MSESLRQRDAKFNGSVIRLTNDSPYEIGSTRWTIYPEPEVRVSPFLFGSRWLTEEGFNLAQHLRQGDSVI